MTVSTTGDAGRSDLEIFHVFTRWMLGAGDEARTLAAGVVRGAKEPALSAWVVALVRSLALAEPRGRGREDPFAGLAALLSLDRSVAVDLDHPAIAGDGHRLRVLQWELKRACLAGAVRALWPTRRAMFVLLHVLGRSPAWVAEVFETTVSSVRITNARTLRTLEGYLQGRCQHLDPANPCSCEARLGVALAAAFVTWPAHPDTPDCDHFDGEKHDLADLYRSLPPFHLDEQTAALLRRGPGDDASLA
jgi:DNA-directed RNA polymerase specialized sigma24 family protein